MDNAEFWLRILMVSGLRSKQLRQLSSKIPARVANVDSMLYQLGFNEQQRTEFNQPNEGYLQASLEWLKHSGNSLMTYDDGDYPELLRHIRGAPLVLFVSGNAASLSSTQLAMVGSRNYSHYGEYWGRYFAGELAASGLTITSGLAIGIDGICHRAALDVQGITIAVLGSGLASVTPVCHRRLAERILERNGALVSEFLPTEPAQPHYFPKRNRIISGLSRAVLIVEASLHSGSLITARCALEQGRDVFALPGPLGNNGYEGTHSLIQQGANLVSSPADIIEHLNSSLRWLSQLELPEQIEITDKEAPPFAELLEQVGDEATPIDIIAERTGQSVMELAVKLVELELSGYIASIQGGYVRIRKMQ